jgi:hypothetical protein
MSLRYLGAHIFAAPVLLLSMHVASTAQASSNAPASSATRVAAEMTQGRLSPAESKAGDTVAVRLSTDLKANGQVILKKGTLITGVVRSVSHSEPKTRTPSMIEVDWIVPPADARAVQSVSIALQSVVQMSAPDHSTDSSTDSSGISAALPARVPGEGAASTNPALLSMPSVVAVDHQTTSAIETSLDSSAAGPLFKVGHGELAAAGGLRESVDLFSHLNNDTVITSPSRNFEISSGAQMQLLVGVRK